MTNRVFVASLTLSASALIGIALHEGFRGDAYQDSVNVTTIGFGSTSGVKPGDRTTVERALVQLGADVAKHEVELRRCVTVPLYQYEWDAYTSWAFNVGTGAACGSTLVKKLNALDYEGACNELLRWDKAGGKVLRGLTKRRQDERNHCLGQ